MKMYTVIEFAIKNNEFDKKLSVGFKTFSQREWFFERLIKSCIEIYDKYELSPQGIYFFYNGDELVYSISKSIEYVGDYKINEINENNLFKN